MITRKRAIFGSSPADRDIVLELEQMHGWELKRKGGVYGTFWAIITKKYNFHTPIMIDKIGTIKNCLFCGNDFEAKNKLQQYCSDRCRVIYHSKNRKKAVKNEN